MGRIRVIAQRVMRRIGAVATRGRMMHYVDIFVAGSLVDLGANQQHVLGAHGMNAWKSLAAGAAIAGAKAVLEALRKTRSAPSVK
jgi:hypothetical protein